MRRLLLLLLLLLWWPTLASATTFWTEGYEVPTGIISTCASNVTCGPTGTALAADGWTSIYCAQVPKCSAEVTSVRAHSGVSALRMNYWIGTNQGSTGGADESWLARFVSPSIDEFYERYYVYFECIDTTQPCGFVDGVTNSVSKQHYINPGGTDAEQAPVTDFDNFGSYTNTMYWALQGFGTPVQPCPASGSWGVENGTNGNCGLFPPTPVNMPMNQWVCVETHLKENTPGVADGTAQIWINGTVTVNFVNNVQFRDTSSSHFSYFKIYRQDADNLYRYEDDYVLADTRVGGVGCGSTPPLPTVTNVVTTQTTEIITGTQDAGDPAAAMRVCPFTPLNPQPPCTVYPISQVVGWPASGSCSACQGTLTLVWPVNTTSACTHAQDAAGSEDPVNYTCTTVHLHVAPGPPTSLSVQ